MTILAGDVGGTKVHLALFKKGKRSWDVDEKFHSTQYKSLEEIVAEFLSRHPQKIERACFGVAGPVQNGECHATNLPWVIKSTNLAETIRTKHVELLNDLVANAYGIESLTPDELLMINKGVEAQGNSALISAGTGLGEAGIYWDGKSRHPFATEGGHASFAPETELEVELWHFLKKQFSHISCERILSGNGLVSLYRFLVEKGYEKENEEVSKSTEPARAITRIGMEKKCPACMRTLEMFVSIYGSESGNLALKLFAVGGLYIGGGIAPKIAPFFKTEKFMQRMTGKGRFAPLLSRIPVYIILNENTALLGAARYVS